MVTILVMKIVNSNNRIHHNKHMPDFCQRVINRAQMIQSLSVQKSTDTYRYGHHAVPIQMMVTAAKKTRRPKGPWVTHLRKKS